MKFDIQALDVVSSNPVRQLHPAAQPKKCVMFGFRPVLGAILTLAVLLPCLTPLVEPHIARSVNCEPARPHSSGTTVETIMTAEGLRSYRLHVPPSYTGSDAVPLILNFHGLSSNASDQELVTGLSTRADQPDGGFIAVYPQGLATPAFNNQTHWNAWMFSNPEPDDVAFVDQLLDELLDELCIDASRAFSTGYSNGAMMSVRLACSLSQRIAAIAPVAGVYYPPMALDLNAAETCPDQQPVPVIAFHGTADAVVPFGGGFSPGLNVTFRLPIDDATPADDVMAAWAAHNGCTSSRQESQVSTQVRLIRYSGCAALARVELYAIDGGGHTWPDATVDISFLGMTTHEISANDLMWAFFQGPGVGGVAELPDIAGRPLEADDPSGPSAGVVAGIAVGVAVGAVTLGGAAWRMRRLRRP